MPLLASLLLLLLLLLLYFFNAYNPFCYNFIIHLFLFLLLQNYTKNKHRKKLRGLDPT